MLRWISLALIAVFLSGCGLSNKEIEETVRQSMQQKFSSDAEFSKYSMIISGVQVAKQSGSQYKGIAKIQHEGGYHDVPLEITVDGENVLWSAAPGSFMFLAQAAARNIQRDFETSMRDAMLSSAKDAEDQYRIASKQGDMMQSCIQAGMVSGAYLQAKDEKNYRMWKQVESVDCAAAGVPR